MTPSLQQSDIFSFIATSGESLIVDAKAGTGKTTTCVWSMDYIPKGESLLGPAVIFLAFNKHSAVDLQQRLPKGYVASTFHALGRRALVDAGIVPRSIKPDTNKCRKMVWNACDRNDPDIRAIIQLVSLAKSTNPHDRPSWNELIRRHDILFDEPKRAMQIAERVLERSNENLEEIDFDDMLWLPVLLNASFDKYDYIYVDEAQDTNDIQLEILERLRKPARHDEKIIARCDLNHPEYPGEDLVVPTFESPSRLIAVGDPHQAIYGFRGANSDSMSRIAERFSCTTLPLTVSYRCSKAVVREAQKYLK